MPQDGLNAVNPSDIIRKEINVQFEIMSWMKIIETIKPNCIISICTDFGQASPGNYMI